MLIPKNKIYRSKSNVKKYAKKHPLCQITGELAQDPHHIKFKSQGGGDEDENLISLSRRIHEPAHGPKSRELRLLFMAFKLCSPINVNIIQNIKNEIIKLVES